MTAATKTQRDLYEAAVIERLKESGFLEIEIRTESLMRRGEGYQDEVINAGWHYWNSALSAQAQDVAEIKTSIDTMREAAKEALIKKGWKPGDTMFFHSITELMAAFGMQVYRGDVGCGYPSCKCCADAACEDAVNQHADFAAVSAKPDIAALETQLKHLITMRPNKAALAAFDDDTRMWFVAQLAGTASSRVPLTDIEALVARHLPPVTNDAHTN